MPTIVRRTEGDRVATKYFRGVIVDYEAESHCCYKVHNSYQRAIQCAEEHKRRRYAHGHVLAVETTMDGRYIMDRGFPMYYDENGRR